MGVFALVDGLAFELAVLAGRVGLVVFFAGEAGADAVSLACAVGVGSPDVSDVSDVFGAGPEAGFGALGSSVADEISFGFWSWATAHLLETIGGQLKVHYVGHRGKGSSPCHNKLFLMV
ncbi:MULTISPECIES: hypothetical protein [unclassified Iodidimonas]|uniref:hypothetical protein n=1 Tax=unclassified Iodidimonas TaxID=2626145 RepID=UPI0024829022|nr:MULTISPECIES: hypothetical protein [unclassified Iodidimonas]